MVLFYNKEGGFLKLFMKVFVNLLTTFRLLIIFLFMIFFKDISSLYFLISTVLIFLTDFVDGMLARRFGVQTFFGSHMDTIADKFFSIGLVLMIVRDVHASLLPLLGEIVIAIINLVGILKHKKAKANRLGKVKTWLVAICIIVCYLYYYFHISFIYVIASCIITFVVQCVVMVQYIKYLSNQKEINIMPKRMKGKSIFYYLFDTDYYLKNQ